MDPTLPPESDDIPDETLEQLRVLAAQLDPVPEYVVAAAKAAWGWRTLDSELAELTYDSLFDAERLVGVRGQGTRQLTFTSDHDSIEVEVDDVERRLVDQHVPPGAASVEVRGPDGVAHAEADDLGRFVIERLPHPFSIRIRRPSGESVHTEWTTP